MKTYLVLSFILLLNSCIAQARMDSIETVYVYKHFPERGFTTAGLASELIETKEKGTEKFVLDSSDVKIIQVILKRAKVKKQRQTKNGGGALFGHIKCASGMLYIIFYRNAIMDMSHRRDYMIINEADKLLMTELIARIKKEHEK